VAEHELVALHHVLARAGLGRAEVVADDLEHQLVGGQREHDHHQAALARRMHEAVDGFVQVPLQCKVTLGLALFGAPQHRVQLVDGLARHERAQQRDGGADHRQIHVEVRARVAEQRADIGARQHHGVDLHALGRVGERQHQGGDGSVADDAADRKGMGVAVEDGFDELDRLGLAAEAPGLKEAADLGADAMDGRLRIVDRGAERQVGENFAHRDRQRGAHPVDADRHRAGRTADAGLAEFDLRIHADRAEDVARGGIEKRAVEIAVRAPCHQALVAALHFDPQRHIGALRLHLRGDRRHAARHALPVQLDARHRVALRRLPILGQKIQRRTPGDAAELLVVEPEVFRDQRRMILRGGAVLHRGGGDGGTHAEAPSPGRS